MRCFVALDISEGVRREIQDLIDSFQKRDSDVRWTRVENLHLTLKFLGEVKEESLDEIKKRLEQVALNAASFDVRFKDLGIFPERGAPRVLWVGVDQGTEELTGLAKNVDSAMEVAGFSREEKPFSAHLTLGRVKQGRRARRFADTFRKVSFSSGSLIRINHISLYKSKLTSEGPIYEELFSRKFA